MKRIEREREGRKRVQDGIKEIEKREREEGKENWEE